MRRAFDFYETPRHYVSALKAVIGSPRGRAFAPCVGDHAIVRLFPKLQWTTNDWDPKREAAYHMNAARLKLWDRATETDGESRPFDWTIENPPFEVEQSILALALEYSVNVAFLARLSLLEPTLKRTPFWAEHGERCTKIILSRYSFYAMTRKDGRPGSQSDNQTCMWLVWWGAQRGPGRTYWADRKGKIL